MTSMTSDHPPPRRGKHATHTRTRSRAAVVPSGREAPPRTLRDQPSELELSPCERSRRPDDDDDDDGDNDDDDGDDEDNDDDDDGDDGDEEEAGATVA